MQTVPEQVQAGKLVCPLDHGRLRLGDTDLTAESARRYPLVNGIPWLTPTPETLDAYLKENNNKMVREYEKAARTPAFQNFVAKLKAKLFSRLERRARGAESARAEATVTALGQGNTLCLSIGGGPTRYAGFTNINIGPFQNVDIVGDAYALPYADNSVDAIICEAVLEHLEFPEKAVNEMYRTLKPGGQGYINTPFLQPYHGYPNHFQNWSLPGHERLFVRAGFTVLSSGSSAGPSHVLYHMVECFLGNYSKYRRINSGIELAALAVANLLPAHVKDHPWAHVMASSTYVHISK